MFKFTLLAATFAAFASAYTTPTAQCTDACNPIAKPGLNEVVPAGTAYTITWGPTTTGTVTIVLDKGPSANIVALYSLAEKIANTGTFTWTPATDLEPTGNSGYGLQIINDADGTYQWSTQFGISNAGYAAVSSSAAASGTAGSSVAAISSASASASAYANGTVSSAAAVSSAVAPSGYSNSTAAITSAGIPTGASSTLSTASVTAASSSSKSTASSGAVAMGASVGGAFFAFIAAAVVL